jgi:hypothetical protein
MSMVNVKRKAHGELVAESPVEGHRPGRGPRDVLAPPPVVRTMTFDATVAELTRT